MGASLPNEQRTLALPEDLIARKAPRCHRAVDDHTRWLIAVALSHVGLSAERRSRAVHCARVPQHCISRCTTYEVWGGEDGVVGWDHQKLLGVGSARVELVDASRHRLVLPPRARHDHETTRGRRLIVERRERLNRLKPRARLGILIRVKPRLTNHPVLLKTGRWQHGESFE